MTISKTQETPVDISIYDKDIDEVDKFKYLGAWLNKNLDPDIEIRIK